MQKTWMPQVIGGWCLLALLAGCAHQAPKEIVPLTRQEQEQFFSRAQDERRFWLTRYESEEGPVFAGGHRLHAEKFAQVAFAGPKKVPVPVIPLRLRSQEEHLALLDTSSPVSWMEFGLARDQGLMPVGPPPHRLFPIHVVDPVPGYLSVASRMIIDQLHVDTALLYVKGAHGPLRALTRDDPALAAPIVLGSEFIRAFHYVQFDFPNQTMTFSTTTPYRPDDARLIASVPLRDYFGILAVEGFFNDVPVPFLLDSVGDYHVASTLTEGDTVPHVMLGDLVLRNVPHQNLDALGLGLPDAPRLGRAALSRFIVTIDGKNRRVYFERP